MSHKHTLAYKPIIFWIAGNLLGIGISLIMPIALPFLLEVHGVVASSLIIFIPIGLAQWLVLRRLLPLSPLWIITMPIGFILTFLLISNMPDTLWPNVDDEAISTLTILITAYGTTIGLAQWVVLRRHFENHSFGYLAARSA